MDRFILLLICTISIAIGILCIALLFSKRAISNCTKMLWLAIPAFILAIYSMFTFWIWVYYFNLFFSLPFYIVSILLNYLTWRKNGVNSWVKKTAIIQFLTLILAIAAAFIFSLTKS